MAKNEPEFYKPAEACRIAEVAPYVLRYWETEFSALSEGKEKGAARLYSGRDVKIIARIRELLYDEGFTVAGAKKRLEAEIAEGRFDDDLKAAPPPAEQKKAKAAPAPAPAAHAPRAAASPDLAPPAFLAETHTPAKASPPAPPAPTGFPERKNVLKELKEIARMLDEGKRR